MKKKKTQSFLTIGQLHKHLEKGQFYLITETQSKGEDGKMYIDSLHITKQKEIMPDEKITLWNRVLRLDEIKAFLKK